VINVTVCGQFSAPYKYRYRYTHTHTHTHTLTHTHSHTHTHTLTHTHTHTLTHTHTHTHTHSLSFPAAHPHSSVLLEPRGDVAGTTAGTPVDAFPTVSRRPHHLQKEGEGLLHSFKQPHPPFFETRSCCVVQAGLEPQSSCLSLLSVGITGMHHHTGPFQHFSVGYSPGAADCL
jgi:hypothetical protein